MTAAFTPRSIRRRPQPAACRRPIRILPAKTSPCAATSAGASVARSSRVTATTSLLAADYSQIELRLLAHLSGDEAMRSAFEEGQDIHDFTARQIFNVPPGEPVDANQRRMAKSVNFGLFYGMSDFGLAHQRLREIRASRKPKKFFTTAYFARFPSVRDYIERTIADGRRNGYVSTILGRRRYMPGPLRPEDGTCCVRQPSARQPTRPAARQCGRSNGKLAMVHIDGILATSGLDADVTITNPRRTDLLK